MKYLNSLLSFAIFLLTITSHAQTAREIVNKYLDTVSNGDIHNWEKINSTYKESIGVYSQEHFEQKISFSNKLKPSYRKTWWVHPNKTKDELYDDSTHLKLASVFYFLPSGAIIILRNNPPFRKPPSPAERDEFFSHFLPVQIWKLLGKCQSLDLLGVKEFTAEKLNCYEIRMVVNDRIYMMYINTTSYLLDYWNNREDHDLTILSGFKNYKRIGGLLFPMTDFLKKNGVIYYQSDIKKIKVNPLIDPRIFDYN